MNFDIAIIGGGPAGYTAAERAGANGLKAVLFEKKAMGGVCLNEGCIPTKTLLYSAKILDSIKSASKYGVSAESPSFDLSKIMSRKDKTVKMLTGGVKMTVNSYGVTIVEKEALIEGEKDGEIRITCDGETYSVKYLLVCTGSDTVIPPIPGLSEISYWTSKEALEIKELPKTLVIIGGGVIGMEFASFFNSRRLAFFFYHNSMRIYFHHFRIQIESDSPFGIFGTKHTTGFLIHRSQNLRHHFYHMYFHAHTVEERRQDVYY